MEGDAAREEDAYRAVGRYVVEFSRLVFHMRRGIERQLASDEDRLIAAMAVGEAFANQITEAFFGICEHVADLNEEEKRVGVRLRKEVRDEIKRRNDFTHGDWAIGGLNSYEDPILARVKPGRKGGALQIKELPVSDIEAAADAAHVLAQKVAEFSAICLGGHPFVIGTGDNAEPLRVRHAFRMDGHDVARISPVAINWA